MALAAFDTLESVDTLEKAGFSEPQARAISVVMRKSHESSDVATKADLQHLEERVDAKLEKLGTELRHEMGDLRHEIGDLRKDMDAKFAGMEQRFDAKLEKAKFDLLKWMVGLAIGNFAFLVGIFWKVMSIPVPGATH